jgi:5-oxoprolinase (ATP-hydrolysing) subunit A
MRHAIDLNCDMGEIAALIDDGTQDALMEHVTSVNVACGGHAGDDDTMAATIAAALARGRAVGAHPGYADREHFGRRALALHPDAVSASVEEQVTRLCGIAARLGAHVGHVKPHGALYNQAAGDPALALAIARGVERAFAGRTSGVVLVGLAGSRCLAAWARAGWAVAPEGFADRRYESTGALRSRALPGALLDDPEAAADQALTLARDGAVAAYDGRRIDVSATTLCIHGDTPGAVAIAAAVARRLAASEIALAGPPSATPVA